VNKVTIFATDSEIEAIEGIAFCISFIFIPYLDRNVIAGYSSCPKDTNTELVQSTNRF